MKNESRPELLGQWRWVLSFPVPQESSWVSLHGAAGASWHLLPVSAGPQTTLLSTECTLPPQTQDHSSWESAENLGCCGYSLPMQPSQRSGCHWWSMVNKDSTGSSQIWALPIPLLSAKHMTVFKFLLFNLMLNTLLLQGMKETLLFCVIM